MGNAEQVGNQGTVEQSAAEKTLGNMPSFEEHMKKDFETKKSFEDKAREKGYYKEEDGTWWQSFGDGFDEMVEGFELDEEYPDLADKTEALAEKYHTRYDDGGSLKKAIYKNAEKLSQADDKHLDRIIGLARILPFRVSGTEEILVNYSPDELAKVDNAMIDYCKNVMQKLPDGHFNRSQTAQIQDIFECFVQNYTDKTLQGNFSEDLANYTAKGLLDDNNNLLDDIEWGLKGIKNSDGSGQYFGEYLAYCDELKNDDNRITAHETKEQVLRRYVHSHGINKNTVDGFKNIVFPLIEQQDAEVESILKGGNAYGVGKGEYGIADYAEECLLSTYSPKDINKLVRLYHEIPTSNFKKFEQNRKDASRLQGTVIGGRDFIHDERIGTNEMLSALKDYYDNRNSENAGEYKQKIEELESKYQFGVPTCEDLQIENYEQSIEYMADHNAAEAGAPSERAIDILNRLVENTRPNLLEVPTTKSPELNELMNNISPLVNEKTGEVRVDIREVGPAIKAMNEMLIKNQNQQGIMPSTVSAIAFLDKMSAYALRGVDAKEKQELAFDPNFKEMVRFAQLTSSTEYNERDFENNYRQITSKVNEAYGEDGVDDSKVAEGYKILSQNILKNMQALGKHYASKSTTARFEKAIWSGNLSDELIGLFEDKK